ncbi:PSD1 and planctomycete cytochrome C domain-containing protein [Candidatus Palauibacter sp.]|uniref:PSD1 and planctomycete cytochrome C domain-containing protein n=1 Tax=Candidatus Palauibacter sp. TaxID=3101350 RepID=UPI003AF2D551
MTFSLRRALPVVLGAPLFTVPVAAQSPEDFFETRVRPVLAESCYSCHGRLRSGGLRVNSLPALLNGGVSGPAIVPGDPAASLLIQAVRHEIEGQEMPREADPLTAHEIAGLVEWIGMGAPWPEDEAAAEGAAVLALADEGLSPGARIFVDKVRPVMERSCFTCHTDGAPSGLRLDSREGILEGGSRGPAIIPGNPEQSLLVAALRHERDDLQMPKDSDRLSGAEIQGFVDWIQAGAEWAEVAEPLAIPRRAVTVAERGFWSFRLLAHPTPPEPERTEWARTEIDPFVLAKHEEKGLEPLEMADRRQLIRRATFDLTGLPPTPEQIEEFVNDPSPDAFEKVVERLLASPHYGERWGRHWLDVARYGEDDTRGLARDGSGRERYPSAYVQRDWVVEAFNRDMAWDRFVKAQLAGDLLEEPERGQGIAGLGFLGGGPWYYDLADPPVARADERHDRVDVTTRGFLGLTVGCARCHDHKYDPIGTHDYHAVAGIFNNSDYHEYPLADKEEAEAYEKDKEFVAGLKKSLNEYLRTEGEQLARVLSLQVSRYMMAARQVAGKPQLPVEQAAARAKVDLETLQRWIRFLAKEPRHYPFLKDWQAMIARGEEEEEARKLADDFQHLVLELMAEQEKLEERNRRIIAKGTPLEEVKSTPMPNGFESFFDQHQLELETMGRERFNLYTDIFRSDLDNELDTFFPAPGLFRFSGWGLERQLGRVAMDHVTAMRERIEELEEELPDVPFAMGVRDKEPGDLTDINLHIRGSPTNLGEKVPRGFLTVLSQEGAAPFTEGSGRLQLAEAIAAHPITARVIVNRVWRWHMGSGIVDTPSNFGVVGERPTNSELLEHLASRFVEHGMSIKQLHRDIMLSATYQLASGRHAGNEQIDGANRYYWRHDRRRLDAESIRDAILHVSGDLDTKVGGPSLDLRDEKNNRRTVYSKVSRFQVDEYLQTFDFPNSSLSAERRYTTNVPGQSLYFMNSPFVQRQAELLVKRLAKETAAGGAATEDALGDGNGDAQADDLPVEFRDREMIVAAYPLLYGRGATEPEIAAGLEFLDERRAAFIEDDASMRAWVQYARALFSVAEFRFVG